MIFLFLIVTNASNAQHVIEGIVIDQAVNEPIVGANVFVKSTLEAATTDTSGRFKLTIHHEIPFTLITSYVGYGNVEIDVYEIPEGLVEIKLRNLNSLNELVVVGYGTQERKSLIGSVSKIDPIEIKQIPVASFDAQLQGKAAGVQVNSYSGMPGEGVKIRVRGSTSINASNDPLYVVDGVFINSNSLRLPTPSGNGVAGGINLGEKTTTPLADIASSDIESIEVLKDAEATAIYGSRGANGVVIVTTKRGGFNAEPKIAFNTLVGLAAVQKSRLWKVASGPQHAEIVNEQWINSGIDNPSLNQNISNVPFQRSPTGTFNPGAKTYRGNPEDQGTYTQDRLNAVFRNAVLQSYDLSAQGGSSTTRYYIGGAYTNQEAVVQPANFTRASLKVNLDNKINDRVQIGVSNLFSRTYRQQVRAGNGPDAGIFQSALQTPSYLPPTDANGNPLRWANFDNTQVLVDNAKQYTASLRYIGNLYLDAEILPRIKFRSSWGLDYNHFNEAEYYNTKTQIGSLTGGEAKNNLTQNGNWVNEQTISYTKQLSANHNIKFLAGNTIQANNYHFDAAAGTGFPSDAYTQISAAANRTSAQSKSRNTMVSVFARGNYDFSSKYYAEATIRADASSKFGADHRWGYFPAVGFAWRLKEESFLKSSRSVTDLKLRTSFGITGNQNGINDFASRGLWTGGAGYPDNPTSGDKSGTAPLQLANPDLKWEKTTQYNAGVDLSLYDDRLSLELNVYSKYTKDALLSLPVPSSTGYSTYLSNAGEISNKGYELSINAIVIQHKNFKWNSSFNISGNVNKIEKLNVPLTFYSRDWIIAKEGHSLYSFWLYKQLYVDPQTGNAVFQKADGITSYSDAYSNNITLTNADRQIIGNAMPKFFGGFTNSFSYYGFDLNAFFSYQYGNKLINYNRFLGEKAGTNGYAGDGRFITESQMDRWTTPGQITSVPRLTSQGNNYLIEQNSRFLEDASFIRLKTLSIGYTFAARAIQKARIQKLRVYVFATNVLLFTKYTGPDPEISVTSDQNAPGLDQGTPPQPRSLQLGINLTLK